MNANRFEQFSEAYRAGLFAAVHLNPGEYALRHGETDEAYALRVSTVMLEAIKERGLGSVRVACSDGFKRTCGILGIRYTVKAIAEFLECPTRGT